MPIKFNKLISEIQVLCWSINHSFYSNTKTLVKWNKMFRWTIAEHGFYSIAIGTKKFRHGEEVKCYKPLSGSMENMAILGLRFCFIK